MQIDNQIEETVKEMIEQGIDSLKYHYDIYSENSEARDYLHDQIIDSILNQKNSGRNRQIFMLGGAPANGKSSFLNSGIVVYPDNALKIDPDHIKSLLPEYQLMVKNKEPLAAVLVHEESSFIAKQTRIAAMEQGIDLIIDGVANDILAKRKEDVEEIKTYGYSVRIDYVTLDTALSLKLARQRFNETGRMVPEEYIIEKNKMIALLIPQLIENDIYDELYLWDTNNENKPRLILSQKNSKLHIEDSELFAKFKNKGND